MGASGDHRPRLPGAGQERAVAAVGSQIRDPLVRVPAGPLLPGRFLPQDRTLRCRHAPCGKAWARHAYGHECTLNPAIVTFMTFLIATAGA